MNNLSPFSGLSLIIHLVVIGVATILKFIAVKTGVVFRLPTRIVGAWTESRSKILPAFSVAIIVFVTGVVSVSTGVAIRTGLREGANESHRVFIASGFDSLQNLVMKYGTSNIAIGFRSNDLTSEYSSLKYDESTFKPESQPSTSKANTSGASTHRSLIRDSALIRYAEQVKMNISESLSKVQ